MISRAPAPDSSLGGQVRADAACGAPGVLEEIQVGVTLENGTNVLAVQGHNVSLGSSDFSIIPGLIGQIDTTVFCPMELSCRRFPDGVAISW